MGLVLGLSLGVIGYVRASLTHETTLRSDEVRDHPFEVELPAGVVLDKTTDGKYILPAGLVQQIGLTTRRDSQVELPTGTELKFSQGNGKNIVKFPAKSTYSASQIDRWTLAIIVSCAVAAICLLGTVVGALLPLLFKTLGFDPALASSPFVATAVDVTGIVIFFNIACWWIPGLSG
jgi:magnesium transporter